MESWRMVWRQGFCPSLSTVALAALAEALRTNDQRLTQGSTTTPPPLMCVQDWPVEAGDAFAFCGAVEMGGFSMNADGTKRQTKEGETFATVGQCEEFFARCCFDADQRMGEPAACRWFLNWFDDTPRNEMRRELLAEVEAELTARTLAHAPTATVDAQ